MAGDVLPTEIPCTPQIQVTKRRTAGDATRIAGSEMQQRVIADDVLDTRTGAQRAARIGILRIYIPEDILRELPLHLLLLLSCCSQPAHHILPAVVFASVVVVGSMVVVV